MVLSTTKKCQAIQSITNNTCILGGPKKGGLITMQGRNPNLGAAITSRAPYCCVQTNLGCIAGLAYLRANNLMTMNPQCSGGVPHRMYRGCRSSDPVSGSSASPSPNPDIQLSSIATQGPANTYTLIASTTIGAGYTLTIPSGTTLIIPVGMTLTVNGTLVNNGTLTVNGTLVNNNNTIINNLIIHNNGAIINNVGGNIANNAGATINSNSGSRFTNNGAINNNGIMMKNSGSTFTNNAVITNLGVWARAANSLLANYGTIGPNTVLNQIPISSIASGPDANNNWTLNANYTIQNGYYLQVDRANALTIPSNMSLLNYGTIILEITLFPLPGVIAPAIPGGILNNNGSMTNYGTFAQYQGATITNDGSIYNTGTMYGGQTNNNGTFTNSGTFSINYSGTFTNYGTITNNNGGTITVNSASALNNYPQSVNGVITSIGAISNSGGTIQVNPLGMFTNNGIFTNDAGGKIVNNSTYFATVTTITNKAGCTITNNAGATFTIRPDGIGLINNSGTVANYGNVISFGGIIDNKSGGTITNYKLGSINVGMVVQNVGLITGSLYNYSGGTINNNLGGAIFITTTSNFTNQGTINNAGNIYNSAGIISMSGGTYNGNAMIVVPATPHSS